MKTVPCYSVRVRRMKEISPKAVLIETFDGRKDVFPKSQIYGIDPGSGKSEAYWISAWILECKDIQYSHKRMRLVSATDSGNTMFPPKFTSVVVTHNPEYIAPVESNEIDTLRKPEQRD